MTDTQPGKPAQTRRRQPLTGASAIIAARMAPLQMSRRQLAEAIGMSASTLGDRMRGLTEWRATELATVAQVLGLDAVALVTALVRPEASSGDAAGSAAGTSAESMIVPAQPSAPLAV
jgi:hypothetical protein